MNQEKIEQTIKNMTFDILIVIAFFVGGLYLYTQADANNQACIEQAKTAIKEDCRACIAINPALCQEMTQTYDKNGNPIIKIGDKK